MLKVALIGYGYWGSKLARNFHNSEYFSLSIVADKDPINLSLAKKNYPLIEGYLDYKKAIKNPDIDLVIIASPTISHFKIAEFSLKNLKHVLVEKPLSLSLSDVKKLNKLSIKKNKMIFVDYPFLFSGTINFIKNIIDRNTYGKILEIESFREKAPVRNDANVIWDLGTHDVSILFYLLKKNPYQIKTIKMKNKKESLCDCAYINLKYNNNINVLIKNSWVSPTKIRLIKIKFTKAIIYCDENESLYKIKIYRKNKKQLIYNIEIPEIDLTEPLLKLAKYISKSIRVNRNKLFENNLNENITRLLEKINKSND